MNVKRKKGRGAVQSNFYVRASTKIRVQGPGVIRIHPSQTSGLWRVFIKRERELKKESIDLGCRGLLAQSVKKFTFFVITVPPPSAAWQGLKENGFVLPLPLSTSRIW